MTGCGRRLPAQNRAQWRLAEEVRSWEAAASEKLHRVFHVVARDQRRFFAPLPRDFFAARSGAGVRAFAFTRDAFFLTAAFFTAAFFAFDFFGSLATCAAAR